MLVRFWLLDPLRYTLNGAIAVICIYIFYRLTVHSHTRWYNGCSFLVCLHCMRCVHVLTVRRLLLHLLLLSSDDSSPPPPFLESAIGILFDSCKLDIYIYISKYIHMYAYVCVRVWEKAYGAFGKYVDVFICYCICVPSVNNTIDVYKLTWRCGVVHELIVWFVVIRYNGPLLTHRVIARLISLV